MVFPADETEIAGGILNCQIARSVDPVKVPRIFRILEERAGSSLPIAVISEGQTAAPDAQFAGSSSVPAHVEMMGFLGMGNNPMVGATVAVAVSVAQALTK